MCVFLLLPRRAADASVSKCYGRAPKEPLLSLTERFFTSCVSDAYPDAYPRCIP